MKDLAPPASAFRLTPIAALLLAVSTSCVEVPRLVQSIGACGVSGKDRWALVDLNLLNIAGVSECGTKVNSAETSQPKAHLADTLTGGQGYLLATIMGFPLMGQVRDHQGRLVGSAFPFGSDPRGNARVSPDGRMVAWVDGLRPLRDGVDPGLKVLSLSSHQQVALTRIRKQASTNYNLGWTPNSEEVLVAEDGIIHAVRVSDGRKQRFLEGRGGRWSPNGEWFALVDQRGELAIIEQKTGKRIRPAGRRRFLGACVEWTPDSDLLGLCELASPQPDPENRVYSFVGVFAMREGKYRELLAPIWGESPNLRWVRMDAGGIATLERALKDFSLGR